MFFMRLLFSVLCGFVSLALPLAGQSADEGGDLPGRQQHIVKIAALTAQGDLDGLRSILGGALDGGLMVSDIREVLVHSYAYCGFPRCLRGLQTFISVLDERKEAGVSDPIGREASPVKDDRSRYERGCAVLAEISGVPADAPRAAYAEFAPVIDRFLKEHLFADVFERDVLTYRERELTTVSILAALGGLEPMARSHMGICLNLGVSPGQLHQLLDIVEVSARPSGVDSVRRELDKLLREKGFPVRPASIQRREGEKGDGACSPRC